MRDYVAAIDQGTTGTRCILFDLEGRAAASAYREHRQIFPQPGWVEHDPLEIRERVDEVIFEALRAAAPGRVLAIGITNQRETVVAWDARDGRPAVQRHRLAGHAHRPGVPRGDRARMGGGRARALGPADLDLLLRDQDPVAPRPRRRRRRARALGRPDARHDRHLGDLEPDRRPARRRARDGSDQRLAHAAVQPRRASSGTRCSSSASAFRGGRCRRSGRPSRREPYGFTAADGPFGARIPVCGDLGDQQAALAGQACFAAGEAKNTYGTGSFLLEHVGGKPVSSSFGLLSTAACAGPGEPAYALEGSVAVSGAAVQWLRDSLGLIASAAETESIAASVPDAGGVYFVPAFSGLFAPHWDMQARGAIVGLTRFAHARAPGAGDARSDLLPEPRGRRGDGGRQRKAARRF